MTTQDIPTILVLLLAAVLGVATVYLVIRAIREMLTFKRGHNPYARICKRCGAHQHMYQSNVEGEYDCWWEEVHPIGDDPDCKCHRYAKYKEYGT